MMNQKKLEELEEELNEDRVRELSRELDDGTFDEWVRTNFESLSKEFLSMYSDEWKEFCEERFDN